MLDVKKDEKVKKGQKVIRAIVILNKPIPKTDDTKSCQIIIPQRQTGRKSGNPRFLYPLRYFCDVGV
jgi:Rab GDP dissociation inhibitor